MKQLINLFLSGLILLVVGCGVSTEDIDATVEESLVKQVVETVNTATPVSTTAPQPTVTKGTEPTQDTQETTAREPIATPMPRPTSTSEPLPTATPTPIIEIQSHDCDDIRDLDQRAMCQAGLETGSDMEEMMENMDFDMEDMMENIEQMNCDSIRDELQRMACEMSQQMGLDTDQTEVDECDTETNMMKRMMCKMTKSMDLEEVMESMDMSKSLGSGQQDAQTIIDPANPPKVATHNFIDLKPFIRITKIRAAYGHNYNYGSSDFDPTGASCSSMKHYFDAYTSDQRWWSNFGSYDTRGIVKFYSPVDGDLYQIIANEIEQGTEYQFYISPSGYQKLTFTFHHVGLLEEFINGGTVTAGQHIGYIIRPNGQGEIAVSISGDTSEYISFFDVMTDEVFAEYQARGITSRAQMTIPQEERAANPIPCTLDDGMGGKFYSVSGDVETFNQWQDGSDNWVQLTN